jgi:ABC-2 type transport system permease protein
MRSFFGHFSRQLLALFTVRKLRLLLLIFVGSCVLAGEIYRERVVRNLPIAVVDLDHSRLSRTVRLYLEATPELAVQDHAPTSIEEAQAQLVDGTLAGLVVLPADLSVDLKRGRPAKVLIATDMSNILVGRTAYRAIAKVISTVAGGAELSYLQKTGVPSKRAMARVLPVVTDDRLTFNPAASYAVYMAPSATFFFLNLVLMVLMGFLFLPHTAAKSVPEFLARFLALWCAGMVAGLGLAYGLLPFVGLTNHSGPEVFTLALAAFCAVDLLLPVALQALLPSRALAFQTSLLLGVLSLMLSGATFPVDAVPKAFQVLSSLLPFTPFSRGLRLFFNQALTLPELTELFQQLGLQAALFGVVIAVGALARALAGALHRRTA